MQKRKRCGIYALFLAMAFVLSVFSTGYVPKVLADGEPALEEFTAEATVIDENTTIEYRVTNAYQSVRSFKQRNPETQQDGYREEVRLGILYTLVVPAGTMVNTAFTPESFDGVTEDYNVYVDYLSFDDQGKLSNAVLGPSKTLRDGIIVEDEMGDSYINATDEEVTVYMFIGETLDCNVEVSYDSIDDIRLENQLERAIEIDEPIVRTDMQDSFDAIVTYRWGDTDDDDNFTEDVGQRETHMERGILYKAVLPAGHVVVMFYDEGECDTRVDFHVDMFDSFDRSSRGDIFYYDDPNDERGPEFNKTAGYINQTTEEKTIYFWVKDNSEETEDSFIVNLYSIEEMSVADLYDHAPALQEGDNEVELEESFTAVVPHNHWDPTTQKDRLVYDYEDGRVYKLTLPSMATAEFTLVPPEESEDPYSWMCFDCLEDGVKVCGCYYNANDGHPDFELYTDYTNTSDKAMDLYLWVRGSEDYVINVNIEEYPLLATVLSEATVISENAELAFTPEKTVPAIRKNIHYDGPNENAEYRLEHGIPYRIQIPAGQIALLNMIMPETFPENVWYDAHVDYYENPEENAEYTTYQHIDNGELRDENLNHAYVNMSDKPKTVYVWLCGDYNYTLNVTFTDATPYLLENRIQFAEDIKEDDNIINANSGAFLGIVKEEEWVDDPETNEHKMVGYKYRCEHGKLYKAVVPAGAYVDFAYGSFEDYDEDDIGVGLRFYENFDGQDQGNHNYRRWRVGEDEEGPVYEYEYDNDGYYYYNDSEEDKTIYLWATGNVDFTLMYAISPGDDFLIEKMLPAAIVLDPEKTDGVNEFSYKNSINLVRHWYEFDPETGEDYVKYESDRGMLFAATVPAGKFAYFATLDDFEGGVYEDFDEDGELNFDTCYWNDFNQDFEHGYANLTEEDQTVYIWARYRSWDMPEESYISFKLYDAEEFYLSNTLEDALYLPYGESNLTEFAIREAVVINKWYDHDADKEKVDAWTSTGTLFKFEVAPGKAAKLEVNSPDFDLCSFSAEDPEHMDCEYHYFERTFTNTSDEEPMTVYFWRGTGWNLEGAGTATLTEIDLADLDLANNLDKAIELDVGQALSQDFSDNMFEALYRWMDYGWDEEYDRPDNHLVTETSFGVLLKVNVPNDVDDTLIEIEREIQDGYWFDALIYENVAEGELTRISTSQDPNSESRVYYNGEAKVLYIWVIGPTHFTESSEDIITVGADDVTGLEKSTLDDVDEMPWQKVVNVKNEYDIVIHREENGIGHLATGCLYSFNMEAGKSYDVTFPGSASEGRVGLFTQKEDGTVGWNFADIPYDGEGTLLETAVMVSGDEDAAVFVVAEKGTKFAIGEDLSDNPFIDIYRYKNSQQLYYYDSVLFCLDQGIMSGYSGKDAGKFGPDDTLTKGQLILMLYRLAGEDAEFDDCEFDDVNKTKKGKKPYYFDACQWGKEQGIITGVKTNGKLLFGPEDPVTRADCASMLMRYSIAMGLETEESVAELQNSFDLSVYKDTIPQSWRKRVMKYAGAKGLITGSVKKDGVYANAMSTLIRKDAATIFARFMKTYELVEEEEIP